MSIDAELIDKRVIRRYLERGVVDRAQFQKHLDQLPDCADKCMKASPETADESDASDDAPLSASA